MQWIFLAMFCLPWIAFTPARGADDGPPFRGRIAYSCDGNHNDPDDWAASPVALAIFAEMGLRDRLVHFDYNCILPQTDAEFERQHAVGVLGAAERYGYDRARLHDCRTDPAAALASLTRAINDSTAADPLWLIIAGPVEAPFRALQAADPEKRRFVWCVSHSRWNDGFSPRYTFTHTKRAVIGLDVNWVQIRDQNRLLSLSPYNRHATPGEFAGFFWMRDAPDARVRFLWERMLASKRPDPSDAGMAWFVATGDEDCDPQKLRSLLDAHQRPVRAGARATVRIEAENFRHLEGGRIDDAVDRAASHRLHVIFDGARGGLRTRYAQPYAPAEGPFDIEVRHQAAPGARARFAFFVNGAARAAPWEAEAQKGEWRSHTLRGVQLRAGDELRLEVTGAGAKVDHVELKLADAPADARADAAVPQTPRPVSTRVVTASGPVWKRHTIDAASRGADGVKLGDLDGDGLPDIVTGWEEGGVVRACLNPGPARAREPWPAVTVGTAKNAEEAIFADLDGDGRLEILSGTEGGTRTMYWHRFTGATPQLLDAAAWRTDAFPVTARAQLWMQAAALDLDGQCGPDVLLGAKGEDAAIGWLRSPAMPGDPAAWTYHRLRDAGWIMSLIPHDVNGDGDVDVVLTDRMGKRRGAFWLENPGAAANRSHAPWREHAIGAPGREAMFADIGDVDGDGLPDVAIAVKPADIVLCLRQPGGGWRELILTLDQSALGDAKAVKIADVNGDGLSDLLFTCEGAAGPRAGVVWLEQQRNGPWLRRPLGGPDGVKFDLMQTLDLDGDGDPDVITCEERDNLGVVWYENPAASPR